MATTKNNELRPSNTHKEAAEKLIVSPWESPPRKWSTIFLISCLIGVIIDPLFLYIPIINEEKKCLRRDERMKDFALVLRSVTDLAYVLHTIFRLRKACVLAKKFNLSKSDGFPWFFLLIDILSIIPVPQVIVIHYFSEVAGSTALVTRKVLNFVLLLQYVPRILRIYLSAIDIGRNVDSITRRVWVRGAFNFLIYIIAGHVFGAFWYLHSIFRVTACWHKACIKQPGCNPDSTFDCHKNVSTLINLTFLNDSCPVNPVNSKVFDFGIFAGAIESRILTKTDFPKKFFLCFWWGLRNLSSFGQNLQTTDSVVENIFAILISVLGLLLFLYLIGQLQTYIQLATERAEATRKKIRALKPEIKSHLLEHGLPESKVKIIMRQLTRRVIKEDKDFEKEDLLSLLDEYLNAHHKST